MERSKYVPLMSTVLTDPVRKGAERTPWMWRGILNLHRRVGIVRLVRRRTLAGSHGLDNQGRRQRLAMSAGGVGITVTTAEGLRVGFGAGLEGHECI